MLNPKRLKVYSITCVVDCSDGTSQRVGNGNINPTKCGADYRERTDDPDRDEESNQTIFNDSRARFVCDETHQDIFHCTSSPFILLLALLQRQRTSYFREIGLGLPRNVNL